MCTGTKLLIPWVLEEDNTVLTGDGMELCCGVFAKDDVMAATLVCNFVISLDDERGMC